MLELLEGRGNPWRLTVKKAAHRFTVLLKAIVSGSALETKEKHMQWNTTMLISCKVLVCFSSGCRLN